ncbi:MAG TPA: ATP-binding protein, partial [Verrucomicrobiota bacterium]|nr:ATP-binding protein [Verrucomicrobiota bacterium]
GLLDEPPVVVLIVVDSRQRIRTLSAGARNLLGEQASKNGGSAGDFTLPGALRRVVERVSKSGKPVENRRVTLEGRSGSVVLTATASPLTGGKTRCGVVLALSPVDPLRQFETQILRLDRLANIGLLSAGMTHEIKNALVSVKTFIDLLLDRNQDAELADVVGREMRRINALVSQTLKYAGPGRAAFSAVRLHDVLDHSLRMVQPLTRNKVITIKRSFQAASDMVRGDDYQLEQVFVNLFLNAVEAMGASGLLTIATETASDNSVGGASGQCVRVTISDTGAGVAPGNMRRLFEPFFTTKQEGTGLGLTIARRIIKEHSGAIKATSELNKGTVVTVLLPSFSGTD